MARTLFVLFALGASALPVQAQSMAGTWQLNFPAGMRMTNGEATVLMATGSLTLQAKGDSLVGELVTDPNPDVAPRPAAHLAGKPASGETVLVARTKATINMNGAQQEAVAVSTWKLHVKGDSLLGTVERKIEGLEMANQEPRPVSGVRRKG